MIDRMPRPRKPFLHKEISRHGKTTWYVRLGKGKRTRIPGDFGTPEFDRAYAAAVAGKHIPPADHRKAGAGTIAWAINLYRRSTDWTSLSAATRKQRDAILKKIADSKAGADKLTEVTRASIVAGRDRRADTPAAARHFIMTMRHLFKWAVDNEFVSSDPTAGVVAKAPKTEGHPVWTEEDIEAFERRWPVGTRQRVAFDILLHTGLRRGDAVKLGRQHVKAGIIRMRTEKTGERVTIVITDQLAATLAAGPSGDLTFIAGEKGAPRVKEAFGEWFREACHEAGVRKSAHGLRKAAATYAANNGASEAELEAMFGWRGGRMAAHYTRSADRERLSISAAEKLAKKRVGKGAGDAQNS